MPGSPLPAVSLETGRVLDARYQVVRRVAAGGFGDVFECLQVPLGTRVALKVLREGALDPALREEQIAAILIEARRLARVRHPNIVAALDAGRLTGDRSPSAYVALEWCAGSTLTEWVEQAGGGKLSIEGAFRLVEPMVRALAHVHDLGLAHRDIKPSNVMVESTPQGPVPRIIDFGIAKVVAEGADPGSGDTTTTSATTPYTPAYAAPEQIVRARTGPWTDVHAMGLVFVRLVSGKMPYVVDPIRESVAPARPTPAARGVDAGALEAVWAKALALRPRDRFRDARALHAALIEAAARHGWSAEPLPAPDASSIAFAAVPEESGEPEQGDRRAATDRTDGSSRREPSERPLARPGLSRRAFLATSAGAALVSVGAVVGYHRLRDGGPRRLVDLDLATLEARLREAARDLPFDPGVIGRFEDRRPGFEIVTVFWATRGTVRLEKGDTPARLSASLQAHVTVERRTRSSVLQALDPDATLCVSGVTEAEVASVFHHVLGGIEPAERSSSG